MRAGIIGYEASVLKTILQALYYGTALMAQFFSLPLIAITLLLLPLLIAGAKKASIRFDHPALVAFMLWALFCTQLAPPLYSGVFIGGGRIVNTYFDSFVVLWFVFAFYLVGFMVQRERIPVMVSKPIALLLSFCLLCVGVMGFQSSDDELLGLQNLAGASAALSILTGEAAQYDAQMSARETLLNDDTLPVITLSPLTSVPSVFMDDLLSIGATYDARPSLCLYYQKEAILLEGEASYE